MSYDTDWADLHDDVHPDIAERASTFNQQDGHHSRCTTKHCQGECLDITRDDEDDRR